MCDSPAYELYSTYLFIKDNKPRFVDRGGEVGELLLLLDGRCDYIKIGQSLEIDVLLSCLGRLSLKNPLKKAKPIMKEDIINPIFRRKAYYAVGEASIHSENRSLGDIRCNRDT